MANGDDDQWPECDPEYIEALGRAVYNFAYLELGIVHVIERLLGPDYRLEYVLQKKTAGTVARDLAKAMKGHAAETKLADIYKTFVALKVCRDELLHASPAIATSDGARLLYYQPGGIAWDIETVRKAATDFATAAETANLLYGALKP